MALKQVIIGGGTGFIGSKIIEQLRNNGIAYTIISRKPGPGRISWQELEQQGLPENTFAVINVAGQNVLDPMRRWTPDFKQEVRNSRIKTTETLAKAVTSTKAKAFVTISGVAYYEPNDITYSEDIRCKPYDFFSELCHDWEAAAQLPSDCNTRHVTIRSGVVLGKDGGMIKSLYFPFFLGMGHWIGVGNQFMPWIHSTDLARLFLFALQNDNASGILNGVSPQIITNKQFSKAFASAMERPLFFSCPAIIMKVLLGEERATMILDGQEVMPKQVLDLGFKYFYPNIESACKECTM